jgi:RNA polymerase sigma factor for flagellar operon FliA
LIERVIASTCRRHAVRGDEAEEFAATVKLHLVDNDYAVLRKFEGKSSLATFLTTVIKNLFRDFRISRWGKWRPSAEALRLGVEAVQLETLLVRDGISFDEAERMLRENFHVRLSAAELAELAAQLPPRQPRRFEGEEVLERLGVEAAADQGLIDEERAAVAARVENALAEALEELPEEDQLILRMHFVDGLSLASIARMLALEQKPLYRRRQRLFARLRAALQAQGFGPEEVKRIQGRAEVGLWHDGHEKESGETR